MWRLSGLPLSEHAADEALVANLAAIGRAFAALRETEAKHAGALGALREATRKKGVRRGGVHPASMRTTQNPWRSSRGGTWKSGASPLR